MDKTNQLLHFIKTVNVDPGTSKVEFTGSIPNANGSKVEPMIVDLGNLEKGKHEMNINIDATPIDGDKLKSLASFGYVTYEK